MERATAPPPPYSEEEKFPARQVPYVPPPPQYNPPLYAVTHPQAATQPQVAPHPTEVPFLAYAQPHQQIVIVNNPMQPPVGPREQRMQCPMCQQTIVTEVRCKSGMQTHIIATLLCLFGCWPCVWIPYVVDACKVKNHYCPNCQAYLGVYNELDDQRSYGYGYGHGPCRRQRW